MRLVIDCFHPFGADVCIDLRRTEVGMTEQFLNAAEIGSGIQQMGGERMAQFVRRHIHRKPGGAEIQLEIALKGAGCQRNG